jgi:hypothetical protein
VLDEAAALLDDLGSRWLTCVLQRWCCHGLELRRRCRVCEGGAAVECFEATSSSPDWTTCREL